MWGYLAQKIIAYESKLPSGEIIYIVPTMWQIDFILNFIALWCIAQIMFYDVKCIVPSHVILCPVILCYIMFFNFFGYLLGGFFTLLNLVMQIYYRLKSHLSNC